MGWYPNSDGRDMSASLDRWITGNYGEDQFKPLVCPKDGTDSEDMRDTEDPDVWECPSCGDEYTVDDLISPEEYARNCGEDEPADFDERRDMGLDDPVD
jgi:hypothetical protein